MKTSTLAVRSLPVLVALGTAGCIIVPHHATRIEGVEIPESAAAAISPGAMTREEVLHLLGRPSRVEEGGRFFIYHWAMSSAAFVYAIGGPYSAAVGAEAIPTEKWFFCMEFATDGLLLRCERVRGPALFKSDDKTVVPWMRRPAATPTGGRP